jgi:hypothetical protein
MRTNRKSVESGIDGAMEDVAGTVKASADAMKHTAEELSSTLSDDATVPSTSPLLGSERITAKITF